MTAPVITDGRYSQNGISIQELIQKALSTICRHPVKLIGSGRTDAGVHALGQIANFKTNAPADTYRFLQSLNGLLPKDIRIKGMAPASADFHARYSAIGKTYHYHLYLDKVMDPFRRLYCWHVHEQLNMSRLEQAIPLFLGTHDFTSFANEAHAGTAAHDPVRTLRQLSLVKETAGYRLEFEGDGFLYKMVRNIVGTLMEIGSGKRQAEEVSRLFEKKDRRFAGLTAPPQGLFLVKVEYPDLTAPQKIENGKPLSL